VCVQNHHAKRWDFGLEPAGVEYAADPASCMGEDGSPFTPHMDLRAHHRIHARPRTLDLLERAHALCNLADAGIMGGEK
jgi:hypothetical protein